ncbi:hypothetical protein ACOSQ3_021219 [Xanthoceras sorbifolium]
MKECVVLEGGFVSNEEIQLLVLKTCLFFANDGFIVYDCKGELVFRFNFYGPDTRDRDELIAAFDGIQLLLGTGIDKITYVSKLGRC